MIDRSRALSVTRQAEALGISRGAVYYVPRAMSDWDLALVRAIDALHLDVPFAGARMLRRLLRAEFPGVGRRRIGTLMQHMGIAAVCPQPGTSRRHRAHTVFPYLLRHRSITQPNEVCAMDITYIPMARGFVYLAAVMDWASRRVLSWRVSVTLESAFCIAALEDAIARHVFAVPAVRRSEHDPGSSAEPAVRATLIEECEVPTEPRADGGTVSYAWR
jgi:putative transposase